MGEIEEANKRIVRRYIESVLNDGQIQLVDEIFAPHLREQVKSIATNLRAIFPDFHETIDTLIAEGDTVAALWELRGTQHGEFLGIPATGRQIEIHGMSMYFFRDGQIADDIAILDLLEAARQLGATLSPPDRPSA